MGGMCLCDVWVFVREGRDLGTHLAENCAAKSQARRVDACKKKLHAAQRNGPLLGSLELTRGRLRIANWSCESAWAHLEKEAVRGTGGGLRSAPIIASPRTMRS